ncbi:DUF5915 domain-containing protein, partial [Myxococcota bacterium]|nr:DUF5915 domain-containing protein [Myxococcota bacterium]
LYANADGLEAQFRTDSQQLLDRYILAKTEELVSGLTDDLDHYDLVAACTRVVAHIDALNNWYIRRSRPRFWKAGHDQDKQDAYDTLYTALVVLCRAASPLLPMMTEEIHRGLTGEPSVHLCDWPDEINTAADPKLVAEMDRVRDVCSAALGIRSAENVRVRQPLRELIVAGQDLDAIGPYQDLIADEVNVKQVTLTDDIERYATFGLKVNAKVLGPRLGGEMKAVLAAAKQGQWGTDDEGRITVAGHTLEEAEFNLTLSPRSGVVCQALPGNDAIAVLDLALSPELIQEGQARDVVRAVQQARKEADLEITDRIRLILPIEGAWREAVELFEEYIREQTLAAEVQLEIPANFSDFHQHPTQLGGETIRIGIERLA